MLIFDVARGGENLGTDQKRPSQSARGLAQSKSWRPLAPAVNARSVLDCASPLSSLPAKTWTRQFFIWVKCCMILLGEAGVWSVEANPACGGLPWRAPFFTHTPFDSFPVHQRVQDQPAPAHQVWPWMAVSFARPEPRQHRHQQQCSNRSRA